MIKLLIKIALSLALILSLFPGKTRVVIENYIQGDEIYIRCRSSDDNLGGHLLKFHETFSFHFHPSIFGTTKFMCYLQSGSGAGDYAVYDRKLKGMCGKYCEWQIMETGPCLVESSKGNTLFCQPWKMGGLKN